MTAARLKKPTVRARAAYGFVPSIQPFFDFLGVPALPVEPVFTLAVVTSAFTCSAIMDFFAAVLNQSRTGGHDKKVS
jgi:hypothetical protein